MDGQQSPGINYNSIDGLTTVNATSISINGSTINLGDYVTYTNATSTVNLNTKTLTNIANASALTDAVNLQTMNTKTYIGNIASYRSEVPTSGAMDNYFITKRDYQSGVLKEESSGTYKNWYGQYQAYYTSGGSLCGLIMPLVAGSLTFSATNIVMSGQISCGNLHKIANVVSGTNPQDVATVSQIPSITGLVPYTGATSNVDLNGKQLKNIADATALQDAITLSQFGAYRYDTIQNAAVDCYVNCGLSNLTLTAASIGTINLLSRTTIQPTSNGTDIFRVKNAAGTSIFSVDTLTSAISCNTVLNVNSNKIINVSNGSNSNDAVNFGQLSAIQSLPAGSVQGSYIVYNTSGYINNATTSVNIGAYSGKTATYATNVGYEAGKTAQGTETVAVGFRTANTTQGDYSVAVGSNAGFQVQLSGAVALGAYSGQYYQGNASLGSPVMNFDASALTVGTITSWANQGSYGTSGCVGTIGAGGTVYADTYLGGLKGISLPATTQLSISVGAGVVYPNFTVAYVYKLASAIGGSFIEHGTAYDTLPSAFYLSNGVVYSSPPLYYTNLSVGGAFIGIDSSAAPYGPGISIGQGSTQTYIISIISCSGSSYFVQWYALDGLTGLTTSYGPYTRAGYSYGAATNTNLIRINYRVTAQQNPLQILVYNSTFTQVQVNRLKEYLINKWFRRTTTVDNVALGLSAAYQSQGYGSVAIGAFAGASYQGDNAIAIGNKAGYTSQVDNSIILNATGNDFSPTKAGCYITGLRTTKGPPDEYDMDGYRGAQYNFTTKELCYNATQIWNVIIIGQAATDPSATLPLVYFMPTGMTISPASAYTCTVVRNLRGDYTLTFPALAGPNFGTYTTITIGGNSTAPYTDVYLAKWTSTNTIRINSVYALVNYRDLVVGNNMSLRIEF